MESRTSEGSKFQIRTVLLMKDRCKVVARHLEVLKLAMFGLWTDLVGLDGFKRVEMVFSERNTCLFIDLKLLKNRTSRYSCQ